MLPTLEAASAAAVLKTSTTSAMIVHLWGYELNLMSVMIFVMLFGIWFLFYRIQRSAKLDFADMITKDGKSVSLTKVLQLIGGITSTWVIIKLTSSGALSESIFGVYLTYVGAIEGYSKYVAAKYNYSEKSVKANVPEAETPTNDPSLKPPKV